MSRRPVSDFKSDTSALRIAVCPSIPATSSASIRMTKSIGPVTEWIMPIEGID